MSQRFSNRLVTLAATGGSIPHWPPIYGSGRRWMNVRALQCPVLGLVPQGAISPNRYAAARILRCVHERKKADSSLQTSSLEDESPIPIKLVSSLQSASFTFMNDAQLIQRWQRCQDAAERLGVEIGTGGVHDGSYFFMRVNKTTYRSPSLDCLWGFLDGVEAERCCRKRLK